MEYVFRLPDGRRLALWSERNQIVRLVSGGGNRSQSVLRSDFLSDLSATMHDGKIYFVYQNTASMVMLHLPEREEDVFLFGERLESCRHSGLTLVMWQENLYLFYAAWNPVRERYVLKMRELTMSEAGDEASGGLNLAVPDQGFRQEEELLRDLETVPVFQVLSDEDALKVLIGEDCLRLTRNANGEKCRESGSWLAEEELSGLWARNSALEEERSGLLGKISELEVERSSLLRQVAELEEARRESQNQVSESEAKRGVLQKQLHDTQEENDIQQEQIRELEREIGSLQLTTQARLTSAINQYNELAELTRQLQHEGKKWRDRYYQETKKKERSGAVKVKRVSETQP